MTQACSKEGNSPFANSPPNNRGIGEFTTPGEVPPALLKALTKGNLTILSKPDGGIRPIIAREVWLRLLAKTIAAREQPRLANTLAPLQAGVGVRGGT